MHRRGRIRGFLGDMRSAFIMTRHSGGRSCPKWRCRAVGRAKIRLVPKWRDVTILYGTVQHKLSVASDSRDIMRDASFLF